MADIRIKDLTTTASSTASDDFIAVDGTTNGTRKLNAFSPTFGGNATVTGTLTSNGSFAATGSMVSTYGTAPQLSITPSGGRPIRFDASVGSVSFQANGGGWFMGTRFLGSAGTVRGNIWGAGTDDVLDTINIGDGSYSQWIGASSTKIAIPLTTPSTTTSNGALVVGNGTSGGLGVGGNITVGGQVDLNSGTAAAPSLKLNGTNNGIYYTGSNIVRIAANATEAATFSATAATFAGTLTMAGEYLQGSNTNFNITSTATSGNVYIKSNGGTLYLNNTAGNGDIRLGNTGTVAYVIGTSASTSTSSGALVVSGGVGVGNEVSVYGRVRAQLGLHADGNVPAGLAAAYQVDVQAATSRDILSFGDSSRAGLIRGEQDGSNRVTWKFGRYTASTFAAYLQLTGVAATDAVLSVYGTTNSTTTSSGALVVSGGVGVAGAIYAGGDLTVDKTEPTVTFKRAANTNLNIINFWTGASADFGIGLRNTSDSDLHIYNYGTSNDALKIAKSDSLATFGGAVRTSAPSGGTAANWKLGTVATVSPTSPNRTIEVDIGGTIYYLAAKTTNN